MATEKSQPTKDGSQFWKPNLVLKKKTLHWKHAPQHKITCRPHHLHIHSILIQGTPTKLTKPFRLTSLMNCQRLEAYPWRPKFVSTQSLLVKNSMFPKGDFDASNFKSLKWISVYSGLGLRHPPLPSFLFFQMNPCQKNNLQETFPRFNFNKFQPIQTGSFVLTILRFQFHVCRPHLHNCLGSWHLRTRKRHIPSPFLLMIYQLRWWDFPLIIKGIASHKAIRIWRSWDLLSDLHVNNKADGNKPSSETNIMETLPNPSRLALYQLIHTWNNCSEHRT